MASPIEEAQLIKSISVCKGDVNYCSFSPCGNVIATASAGGGVSLWGARDGQEVQLSPGTGAGGGHSPKFYANSCCFSPQGDVLVSVGSDHKVLAWDANTHKQIGSCNGHSGAVRDCAISPNGSLLLTASADKTAKLWDMGSFRLLHSLQRGDSVMSSCCFSMDSVFSVVSNNSGDVTVWASSDGSLLCQTNADDLGVNRVTTSPRSRGQDKKTWETLVMACCNSGQVRCYLLHRPKDRYVLTQEAVLGDKSGGAVYHCQTSPHLTHIATCGADKMVVLWSLETWQMVWKVHAHNRFVTCCSFSPDTSLLATTSNDSTLKLWDISGGRKSHLVVSNKEVAMETSVKESPPPWKAINEVCDWLDGFSKQPLTAAGRETVVRLNKCLQNTGVL